MPAQRSGTDPNAVGASVAKTAGAPGQRACSSPESTRRERDQRRRRSPTADDDPSPSSYRRRTVLAAGGVAMATLAGCSVIGDGGDGGASSDEKQIREVLRENARTMENENLEAHMQTLHPESPAYERTRMTMQGLFQQYDLRVDLSIKSVSVDGNTATAEVVQETRAVGDAVGYQDNRASVTHELRTYEGEWRIYGSTITSIERL